MKVYLEGTIMVQIACAYCAGNVAGDDGQCDNCLGSGFREEIVDFNCNFCGGAGCSACRERGGTWHEIMEDYNYEEEYGEE